MIDDETESIQYQVRWVGGLVASGVLVYLSVLSVREDFTLEPQVIVGLLALIIILMYGAESLEAIIKSWRQ